MTAGTHPDNLSHMTYYIPIKHRGLKYFTCQILTADLWFLAFCCLLIAPNKARWLSSRASYMAVVARIMLLMPTKPKRLDTKPTAFLWRKGYQ